VTGQTLPVREELQNQLDRPRARITELETRLAARAD
jgi:hypothetical protein